MASAWGRGEQVVRCLCMELGNGAGGRGIRD